jgi:hypothetical protein
VAEGRAVSTRPARRNVPAWVEREAQPPAVTRAAPEDLDELFVRPILAEPPELAGRPGTTAPPPVPARARRARHRRGSARRRAVAATVLILLGAAAALLAPVVTDRVGGSRSGTGPPPPEPPPPASFGPNLIANSGFETGVEGWRVLRGTILGSVTPGHDSPVTARLQPGAVGSIGTAPEAGNPGIATTAVDTTARRGQRVRAAAWFRATGPPATVELRVSEQAGTERIDTRAQRVRLTPGEWRQLRVAYEVTRPGSSIELEATGIGLAAGHTLLVDQIEARTD